MICWFQILDSKELLIKSLRGKYSFVFTSSEKFAKEKLKEINKEENEN
ncbi:hypothetical protein M0R19_04635 [Candidatus Pacearchaeota archaeon]|jgi:hypothetical protein|nr:hypothetical protein [Candidatus Pacearchaeota archaeon]